MDQISLWDFAEDFNKKLEEKSAGPIPVVDTPANEDGLAFFYNEDKNGKKHKHQGAFIPSWVSLDPEFLLKNFVHTIYHQEPLSSIYIKRRASLKINIDYENPIEVNKVLKNWIFDISSSQFFSQYKDFTFPDECYDYFYSEERDTFSIERKKSQIKEEYDAYEIHRIGPNYEVVLATFTSAEVLKALLNVTFNIGRK